MQIKQIKIHLFYDQKPKTDLSGTISENPVDKLVRLMQKLAKSVTEISSKIRQPKIYDEVINNSVHGKRWPEAIEEEFWNLDLHQT